MNAYIIHNCPLISSKVQQQMIDELSSFVQNTQRNHSMGNP
jgi:hypothetical protein